MKAKIQRRNYGPDSRDLACLITMPTTMTSLGTQNTSFMSSKPGHSMEPGTKHVILSLSLVVIQIFAIFGNVMLFLVVYRKPHLRTRTNMFILNLACADLGVALFCMPFSVVTCALQSWVFGDALCQFNGFVNITFAMCSLLTLTTISMEKYFAIVKPLYQVMTRQRAMLMLAVTWLGPVLFASLPLTGFTRYEYKEGSTQCGVHSPVTLGQTIHAVLVFLVAYVIPLSIMGFAYVNIFTTARVHNRRISQTSITTSVPTSISTQKQIALTIFIMLVVFIVCWTPYFVKVIYVTANHVPVDQTRDLGLAAYWCAFLNSALDPFIYGIRNPHFKAAFKEIFVSTSRSFRSFLGIGTKRGFSNSSSAITKPSVVSLASSDTTPPNNSDVTPEDSCHSYELCEATNELRMSSPQMCAKWKKSTSNKPEVKIVLETQKESNDKDVGDLVHEDKTCDHKHVIKFLDKQLNCETNTCLASRVNQGFHDNREQDTTTVDTTRNYYSYSENVATVQEL